jgi:hypothetical protein
MTGYNTKDTNEKKNIRTLNWYQRFWYPRQNQEIEKRQEKKK